MVLNISLLLSRLSKRRPVFHSEADFQHEFAFELREMEPTLELRLEVPFSFERRGSTDIVARSAHHTIGIELKYLTKKIEYQSNGEEFLLKAQGATDLRRYDIVKDVQRLERFNQEYGGPSYVVALTNDAAYWRPTQKRGTIDEAFRLCEGRKVTGECMWASHASPGSIKNRQASLFLENSYKIEWRTYSELRLKDGHFKYLLLPVS